MGFLDSKVLQIVQGVAAVPGDSNSVESPLIVLNLLDNTAGISLAPGGWSPNIPPLESSGVWADSPLSPGRQLLVAQEANVTETMQLIISASSLSGLSKLIAGLNSMLINARSFWTDNDQINPTYLAWWASCYGIPSAGAQYALIYNMDIKYEYQDSPTPLVKATLTIEREPLWRFIPPGANPKQWRYEFYNQPYSAPADAPNLAGADSLFVSSGLVNRSEFSSTAFTGLLSDSCIVIPANVIPGDAPALINIVYQAGASSMQNILIGKKTRKITVKSGANTIAQNNVFNGADGTLGTDATLANDTGASKGAGAVNAQRVEVSFATATNQRRWTNNNATVNINSTNRFIGRFMVFMRCRQSAGTLGDITMYMRYGTLVATDTDGVKMNVVNPPITAGGTGNSTVWGMVYMGILTSPVFNSKADVNSGAVTLNTSFGLNAAATANLQLALFASRTAGAGLLYINDVILIPVDEGSIALETADSSVNTINTWYDETGYLSHGTNDVFCLNGNGVTSGASLEKISGTGIQLTPNVENRLYPLIYNGSNQSQVTTGITIWINIVPRCRGIRSVKNVNG